MSDLIMETLKDEFPDCPNELKDEVDELKLELERVTAERDAARLELSQLKASLEPMRKIGELIQSQDNRSTDAPVFCVFEVQELTADPDCHYDRIVWVDDEGTEASDAQAKRLELLYAGCRESKKWRRVAMQDVPRLAAACFTEQGCKEYLELDRHNLRRPYIYASGSHRNVEFRAVRDFLVELSRSNRNE